MDIDVKQPFLLHPGEGQPSTSNQVNLENVADFSSVCRTCAAITEYVVPIFSGEGLQHNLADKIHKHLPIQVSETDELPRSVCVQCVSTLLAWSELVQCCRDADQALRTRLGQMQGGSRQDLKPTNEGNQSGQTGSNECKPCQHSGDDHDAFCKQLITTTGYDDYLDDDASESSEDDEPLSSLATKKPTDHRYDNFYTALLNFRNHFFSDHKSEPKTAEISDSSDSEMVSDGPNHTEQNIDNYDDLTHNNMRKDRMDEETRLELTEVRTKVNGRVYYTCKLCGKNLSSAHTYIFHKRIHTDERPCVCHICGKQFRAPNGLQRHLTETHEKLRRHSCRFCPKNFANSQNLKQHMRIHTGDRPFVCSHCGKRFTQSGSLHVHLKTHSENFPFDCAECGAKFRLRSGLTRHRLKHTGERPHTCTHCGKGFRQKHELNNHVLSHSDAKPFGCVHCGVAFRQRRALTHHVKRLHTMDSEQVREIAPPMQTPNVLVYTQIGPY